jgi:hypothetical protein
MDSLTIALEAIDKLGVDRGKILRIFCSRWGPIEIQVEFNEFERLYRGRKVEVTVSGIAEKHYQIESEGVLFRSCELLPTHSASVTL